MIPTLVGIVVIWAFVATIGWVIAEQESKTHKARREFWELRANEHFEGRKKTRDRVDALTRAILNLLDTPPCTTKRAKAWAALLAVVGK